MTLIIIIIIKIMYVIINYERWGNFDLNIEVNAMNKKLS